MDPLASSAHAFKKSSRKQNKISLFGPRKDEPRIPMWFDLPELKATQDKPALPKRSESATLPIRASSLSRKPLSAIGLTKRESANRYKYSSEVEGRNSRSSLGYRSSGNETHRTLNSSSSTRRHDHSSAIRRSLSRELPSLPHKLDLDKFGLWPVQREPLHHEKCDLELPEESTQPDDIVVASWNEDDNHVVLPRNKEPQLEQPNADDTHSISLSTANQDEVAGITNNNSHKEPTGDSDEVTASEPKSTPAPYPVSKRRKEIQALQRYAFKHIQKRIFLSWKYVLSAFRNGEAAVEDLRKVLQDEELHISIYELESISKAIAETAGDDEITLVSQSTNPAEALEIDHQQSIENVADARAKYLEKQRQLHSGISLDRFSSLSYIENIELHKQDLKDEKVEVYAPKPNKIKSISLELFQKALYPKPAEAAQWKAEAEYLAKEKEELGRRNELKRSEIDEKARVRRTELSKDMMIALNKFDFTRSWTSAETQRLRNRLVALLEPEHPNLRSKGSGLLKANRVREALVSHYAKFGNFDDISVEEAAHILYDTSVRFVQNWYSCEKRKRENEVSAERLMLQQYQLKKAVFHAWMISFRTGHSIIKFCFRKFVAWKRRMIVNKRHRYLVQVCFRPFFVWKRMTIRSINARAKAMFLKQVYETLVRLRHYRAFSECLRTRIRIRKKIAAHRLQCQRNMLQNSMHVWRVNAKRQARVMKAFRVGAAFHRNFEVSMMRVVFFLWRYHAILTREVRDRSYYNYTDILNDFNHKHKRLHVAYSHNRPKPFMHRLMETSFGPKVRRKSIIHEHGVKMFVKARAKERVESIGMAIFSKRICPIICHRWKVYVKLKKKSRFARCFGALKVKTHTFRHWMRMALYKTGGEDDEFDDDPDQPSTAYDDTYLEEDGPYGKRVRSRISWKRDIQWRAHGIAAAKMHLIDIRMNYQIFKQENHERVEAYFQREARRQALYSVEDAFLAQKAQKIDKAKRDLHSFVHQLLRARARKMHDILVRVFTDFEQQAERPLLKSCFRALRVVSWDTKMHALCHRVQLLNWLRICKHHQLLISNITRVATFRLKRKIFREWVEAIATHFLHQSPDLRKKVKTQRRIILKYHDFLERNDAINSSAFTCKGSISHSFHACLLRWVEYAVFASNFKRVVKCFRQKHDYQVLQQVFYALKHQLNPRTSQSMHRKYADCFELHRVYQDLDLIRSRILVHRKRVLSYRINKVFSWIVRRIKRKACSTPNMKHIFTLHSKEVEARLLYENRLMFTAFQERHIHHYTEYRSEIYGSAISGRPFADEVAYPYASIRQVNFICSRSIDGLSIVRCGYDATESTASKLHGNGHGKLTSFDLNPNEYLVALEGYANKTTVFGLRLITSTGRVSKWHGRIDLGSRFLLEPRADEEEDSQRLQHITGFFGRADGSTIYALGAVFRYTSVKNIFAGLWLDKNYTRAKSNAEIERKKDAEGEEFSEFDREFAYFLQLRAVVVRQSLKRAHQVALSAWRSSSIPPELSSLFVLTSLAKWFFNALTFGLVRLPRADKNVNFLLNRGQAVRDDGQSKLSRGENLFKTLDGYERGGVYHLNVALMGMKKIQEMRKLIEEGERLCKEGDELVALGNQMIKEGRRLVPVIPTTDAMLRHVQGLYRLVRTRQYIEQMGSLQAQLLQNEASQRQDDEIDLDMAMALQRQEK